ncbi:hypothetical protein [Paraburkholderia dilworthii]|uniref:Uncharacterized protein n=1 Tax=Paraburkholderia dilworthii TaxID=948106 RepID=A0ABW9D588_9BURK
MTMFEQWRADVWPDPIGHDDIAVLGTTMYRTFLALYPDETPTPDADEFYGRLWSIAEGQA